MEKKIWSAPKAVAQVFEANEYFAACGDSGVVYNFECNAGGGKSGNVYLETNGQDGLQTGWWSGDTYLSGYHACGAKHEAESTDDFLNGYYVVGNSVTPVIVWRGPKNDNTHCTAELDMNKWETAKS